MIRKLTVWTLVVLLIGMIVPINICLVSAQDDCNRSPMQALAVGDRARVLNSPSNDPLHTRPQAGLNGGYTGELVNGDIVAIIDGPICLDNYRFWEISGAGESGWVRDGRDSQLWLERVSTSSSSNSSSNNSSTTTSFNSSNNWSTTRNQESEERYQLNDGEELDIKSQNDGRGRTLATISGGDIVTVIELIESDDMVIAKVEYGRHTGWVLFEIDGEELFELVD